MAPCLALDSLDFFEKDGWLNYAQGYNSPEAVYLQAVVCQMPTRIHVIGPTAENEATTAFKKNFLTFQKFFALYDTIFHEQDDFSTPSDSDSSDSVAPIKEKVKKRYLFRQRNLSYMKHREFKYNNHIEQNNRSNNEKENITPECHDPTVGPTLKKADYVGVLQETQNTNSSSRFKHDTIYQHESRGLITVKIVIEMIQQFLYLTDYKCVVCRIDCNNYKTLKTHLKTCHDRFAFKFEENAERVIRISINHDFDGSYELDPRNNCALMGPKKSISQRDGYCVLVSNELRNFLYYFNHLWGTDFDLQEFAYFSRDPCVLTDFRQYYHSQTCIPILAHEIDIDSEDDLNADYTDWNIHRNIAQIDEFTDVNPGEKEIAKLWNLHLMKNSKIAIGECHIGNVADLFVKWHAPTIAKKGLINNLVLHLCNLHSFGLVKARDIENWVVHVRQVAAQTKTDKAEKDVFHTKSTMATSHLLKNDDLKQLIKYV